MERNRGGTTTANITVPLGFQQLSLSRRPSHYIIIITWKFRNPLSIQVGVSISTQTIAYRSNVARKRDARPLDVGIPRLTRYVNYFD